MAKKRPAARRRTTARKAATPPPSRATGFLAFLFTAGISAILVAASHPDLVNATLTAGGAA